MASRSTFLNKLKALHFIGSQRIRMRVEKGIVSLILAIIDNETQ